VSDSLDRLRQYLEQRRELGESEFVLDGLSVEDALKALGGSAALKAAGGASGAPATGSVPRPAGAPQAPPPRRGESELHRAAEAAAASGDWREALRAVDADAGAAGAPPKGARKPATASGAREADAAPKAVAPAASTGSPPATPATPAAAGAGPDAAAAGSDDDRSPSATGSPMQVGATAAPSGLHHLETLDAVAAAIAGCSLCTLASTAINHVPGEGNPQARFVVVGEAPGQTEDELGRPFVGKSGELLTKILEAIGFKREDVFICNVLKHRPPGNRNPNTDEIHACRPFLLRQLELLEPKVILCVGTFAAQTLLATDEPIGKLRGVVHRYHGIPLVATYHPAALLRNPNWKRPAWEDVQLARRIFDRP
jgi:DNA polymerase